MERKLKKGLLSSIIILVVLLFLPLITYAQAFPTKTITLVNPGGAGGSHDLTARAVTSVSADYLEHPIIVKTLKGGGGSIGSDLAAKAPPDGYTLLWGGPGWSTSLPAIEGTSRGPNDLEAVCRVNYSPGVIITNPKRPYKNLTEALQWAKANPGQLVIGTTGPWGGADMAWKGIAKETGIKIKIVPYDGAESLMAVLGGHADIAVYPTAPSLGHIQAGRLVALAVIDEKRLKVLPNVQTAKEAGVDPPYRMWRGALAPKGTPRPIIEKLAAAFKKMSEDSSVIKMIQQFGDEVPLQYLGPDDFAKVWRAEYELHKAIGDHYKKGGN